MKLLVIEDAVRLRRALKEGLGRSGFTVDVASDGEQGLAFAKTNDYEVVVLDLMLPRLDGLSVLKRLRSGGNPAQVLILSAKDQIQDRVRGLELGADDYLVKPFAFEELLARIRSLCRRRFATPNPEISLDGILINTARRQVSIDDEVLDLTPSEFNVLEYLALRRGHVISKIQLREQLYDSDTDVVSNVIEVLVSGLRKKLRRAGLDGLVRTKRGFGYYVE